MKIRLRLTLQFVIISALITLAAFFIIYALSANYRQEQFHERLSDKAINTAKLFVDVQEIDQNLLRIIEENTISLVDERITLYDFDNNIVYNSNDKTPNDSSALLNRIRLEENISFTLNNREYIGMLYKGKYDRFVVVATAYDQYGLGKLNNLMWVLIFVFFGILFLTFLGGWLFSGQALKPITHVIEEVKQINDLSLGMRVNEGNGTDEIADLAKTFNLMLERLEEAFYSQKSFVSHASHELRTPLTAITGQLEVALMKCRSEEEYRQILASVLEDIRGLSALTNGLLELVQTNDTTIKSGFENIRVDDILFHSIEQAKNKYPQSSVVLDFDNFPKEEEDLLIRGNDYLLKSAFSNLLDNACKFSGNNEVKVTFIHTPSHCIIKFTDKGIGIATNELDKVFQPFYRASNSASFRGYGLGLPLTKKILDMHDADLKIESKYGQGTDFTVILNKNKL